MDCPIHSGSFYSCAYCICVRLASAGPECLLVREGLVCLYNLPQAEKNGVCVRSWSSTGLGIHKMRRSSAVQSRGFGMRSRLDQLVRAGHRVRARETPVGSWARLALSRVRR